MDQVLITSTEEAPRGPAAYVSLDRDGQSALADLSAMNVKVEIQPTAQGGLIDACRTEDQLMAFAEEQGETDGLTYEIDPLAGTLALDISPADAVKLTASLAQQSTFAGNSVTSMLSINTEDPRPFDTTGNRGGSTAPHLGGSLVVASHQCSDAFRVNTTAILTAAHCTAKGVTETWRPWHGGVSIAVSSDTFSLESANVDANLIYGRDHSSDIWLGTGTLYGDTSSQMRIDGIFPSWAINVAPANRSQLVFSGGKTGQTTIEVTSTPGYTGDTGCYTPVDYPATFCHLIQAPILNGFGIKGDSGSPIGVYDPADGRIIAAGVPIGAGGDGASKHNVVFTTMDTISYLYGGVTVG